jgi:hypothetical protein
VNGGIFFLGTRGAGATTRTLALDLGSARGRDHPISRAVGFLLAGITGLTHPQFCPNRSGVEKP